jgi:hypothetical protein
MSDWKFDGTEDQIDSREIIERIEELEAEQADLVERLSNGEITEGDMQQFDKEQGAELDALRALASEAESSPDWAYGEQLIHDSYFVEYTEQLIDDCYPEVSKALASSEWPMRHLKLDIQQAAGELKQDYVDVTFNGSTYWIRG